MMTMMVVNARYPRVLLLSCCGSLKSAAFSVDGIKPACLNLARCRSPTSVCNSECKGRASFTAPTTQPPPRGRQDASTNPSTKKNNLDMQRPQEAVLSARPTQGFPAPLNAVVYP
ncbi:uncharacterized protein EI97DRAFT_281901 [Westerdykella ornata]|uniref:Uncharacterized protein n=1 Tax=Westerdykella ornata TaxID=318751 RepID=A0A6A6JP64_WESOR|nr:uncharacterized protein EI97DRAFT_281901 [Westerdykella ornata]KAF2278035.1 hypothetical protein EI97DRAFT_281901 [Westerdykella ornata]